LSLLAANPFLRVWRWDGRVSAWFAGLCLSLAICLSAGLPVAAGGDEVAEFYRGKRVRIVAGHVPGSAGDAHARLLARHLGQHIPGSPTVIVQNMPGAGSLVATNYLYAAAPADGTVIGNFSRDMPALAILGANSNIRFDPAKFTWLGSSSSYGDDALLLVVRGDSAMDTIEQVRGPGKPLLVLGATGEHLRNADVPIAQREPGGLNLNLLFGGAVEEASNNTIPHVLREALQINLRVISGFPDGNAIDLAIERDEVHGRMAALAALRASRPQWLDPHGPMRILAQAGRATRHPSLPHVPTARELAMDETARQLIEVAEVPFMMSRPYAAPPGVPAERARALQAAFLAVHDDPEFRASAARIGIDVSPIGPDAVQELLARIASAPPEIRDRLRRLNARGDKD
jgi:tripartite-type tricarboxylate transporter receptor subunit TctC